MFLEFIEKMRAVAPPVSEKKPGNISAPPPALARSMPSFLVKACSFPEVLLRQERPSIIQLECDALKAVSAA